MDTKTVLDRARALVEHRWNRYSLSDGHGGYCLRAAIGIASGRLIDRDGKVGYDRTPAADLTTEQLRQQLVSMRLDLDATAAVMEFIPAGFGSIPDFNDDPRTTAGDILAVLDKAISAC